MLYCHDHCFSNVSRNLFTSEHLCQHEDKSILKFPWNVYINLMNHVFQCPIEYNAVIMSKNQRVKRKMCDKALMRQRHWQWDNMAFSSIDAPRDTERVSSSRLGMFFRFPFPSSGSVIHTVFLHHKYRSCWGFINALKGKAGTCFIKVRYECKLDRFFL